MSGEIRLTDSATGATKGSKLERFDLIPVTPLRELARHFGIGSRKYADRNWEKGYPWSWSFAAVMRHLNQFWGGEDRDAETGSKHVISAAWHCLAMAEFMDTHAEKDDRPIIRAKPRAATVYIAGPMRGIPYYNFPAFDDAADRLTRRGWVPVSPADLDRQAGFDAMLLPETTDWNQIPAGFDFQACVERDLDAVMRCSGIFLLPGWEKSKGATAEYALAQWLEKPLITLDDSKKPG